MNNGKYALIKKNTSANSMPDAKRQFKKWDVEFFFTDGFTIENKTTKYLIWLFIGVKVINKRDILQLVCV